MTASGEERNNVFKYLRKEGSVPSGRVSQCYLSGNGYCSHFTGFGGGECRSHISYYSFLDRRRFVPPAHKVEKDTAAVCRRQPCIVAGRWRCCNGCPTGSLLLYHKTTYKHGACAQHTNTKQPKTKPPSSPILNLYKRGAGGICII